MKLNLFKACLTYVAANYYTAFAVKLHEQSYMDEYLHSLTQTYGEAILSQEKALIP